MATRHIKRLQEQQLTKTALAEPDDERCTSEEEGEEEDQVVANVPFNPFDLLSDEDEKVKLVWLVIPGIVAVQGQAAAHLLCSMQLTPAQLAGHTNCSHHVALVTRHKAWSQLKVLSVSCMLKFCTCLIQSATGPPARLLFAVMLVIFILSLSLL
jgi:hypothetical protein